MTDHTEIASRLFDALEQADMKSLRSLYHPDAKIWHNTDNLTKKRDDTLGLVEWMRDNMPPIRYVDRHCSATAEGFVQRHTAIVTSADGVEVELPCCVVATVADAQVTHLYEYFDSATQAQTGVSVPQGEASPEDSGQ